MKNKCGNIPLIGKCKNKISFVHVIDLCRAIEKCLLYRGKHIFNIAADEHEEFQFILRRLIKKVNDLIAEHEEKIANKFLEYVTSEKKIRILLIQ